MLTALKLTCNNDQYGENSNEPKHTYWRYAITIKESVNNVNMLVVEIAAAAKEQTSGVREINAAVSEMDKAVQGNASTSEEAAGSAEELSSQAWELNNIVDELTSLVSGHRARVSGGQSYSWKEKSLSDDQEASTDWAHTRVVLKS